MPRRCANCRAYLALVGVEILKRVKGPIETKKLPEAKEPEIQMKDQQTTEPKPESKPIELKPKVERKKPRHIRTLELESEPQKPQKLAVKAETFECGNCLARITKDMKQCPQCGVELNWSEIYE